MRSFHPPSNFHSRQCHDQQVQQQSGECEQAVHDAHGDRIDRPAVGAGYHAEWHTQRQAEGNRRDTNRDGPLAADQHARIDIAAELVRAEIVLALTGANLSR